jgi:hypothetical protein
VRTLWILGAACWIATPAHAGEVVVSTLDGEEVRGISLQASESSVEVQSADGTSASVPTARVVEILRVPAPTPPTDAERKFEVELTDGTRLRGNLSGGGGDDLITVTTPRLGPLKVSIEALRAVRRVVGDRLPAGTLVGVPGSDTAYRTTGSKVKGTVARFTGTGVDIDRGDDLTSIAYADLAAVMVDNPVTPRAAGLHVVVRMSDGSAILLKAFKVAAGKLRGETAGGIALPGVEVAEIAAMHFQGASFEHVSDLAPKSVERTPFFPIPEGPAAAAMLEFVCPVRMDRSPDDRPIALEGRTFYKGIGVRPKTAITYAVEGGFTRFEATYGIDDEVMGAGYGRGGGTGSVVFSILLDGKEAWRSSRVIGGQAPGKVALPLGSAKTITLVVDLVPPADMPKGATDSPELDNAVWARPLLIR